MTRARLTASVAVVCISCGGASATSAPNNTSGTPVATTTPHVAAAPVLTDAERTACGPKRDAELDSLACLVAERARIDAGDAAGAKAVVAYGCDHGDLDACNDLRALDPSRAVEADRTITTACTNLGDTAKKLAACLRGGDTRDVASEELGAKLSFALAIDLRARHVPALLAQLPAAERACKAAIDAPGAVTPDGTPLAKERAFSDVTVSCAGIDVAKIIGKHSHLGVSSDYTVRSLHDAMLSDERTLRVAAPTGRGESGVYCPSLLTGDDDAADVWARAETDGVTTLVLATVHIDHPCLTQDAQAKRAKERAVLKTVLAPALGVIDDALDKLAQRCDAPIASLDSKKSPLAGHPIERAANVVSFEPSCSFGFYGFSFDTTKPLNHPNPMTSIHEFTRVDGRAMRVEAIEHRPNVLEFTLRRRGAQLVVGVKK